MAMAEPADINVDELRRRARRRLVGAVVLALGVAVVVPMLLETDQKPLGEDVSVKIPPVDSGKFVNRLNESGPAHDAATVPQGPTADDAAKGHAPTASGTSDEAPGRTSKYDTHIDEPPAANGATPGQPSGATTPGGPANPGAPPASPREGRAATTASEPAHVAAQPKAPASAPANMETRPASPPGPSDVTASSQREGFAVQLAAFADDRGANALAGRLKRAGYAAYTEPLKTSKGTLWRVRVGPYPSREAAVTARDKLKTEGQSGIVAAIK